MPLCPIKRYAVVAFGQESDSLFSQRGLNVFYFRPKWFLLFFNTFTSCFLLGFHGDIKSKYLRYPTHLGQNTVTFLASGTAEMRKINHCAEPHRVGSNQKHYKQLTNADQKSIEAVFSIAICRQCGDKWQSKTLFLTIFDLRSSIVFAFSIAPYAV